MFASFPVPSKGAALALPARTIIHGWRPVLPSQVVRQIGPTVTARVIETSLGWLGETLSPPRSLRRPAPSAQEAITALEAAEAIGPTCHEWCDGLIGAQGWVRTTVNGRPRWGAMAYGHYSLVVAELPRHKRDPQQFVAFVNGEPIKVVDVCWEYDNPGEPEPPDPLPFTIFDDIEQAIREVGTAAYSRWIDEPDNPEAAHDSLPGERTPEDISCNILAIAHVFASVD